MSTLPIEIQNYNIEACRKYLNLHVTILHVHMLCYNSVLNKKLTMFVAISISDCICVKILVSKAFVIVFIDMICMNKVIHNLREIQKAMEDYLNESYDPLRFMYGNPIKSHELHKRAFTCDITFIHKKYTSIVLNVLHAHPNSPTTKNYSKSEIRMAFQ